MIYFYKTDWWVAHWWDAHSPCNITILNVVAAYRHTYVYGMRTDGMHIRRVT